LALKDFAAKNAIFRSSQSLHFVKNFATDPEFCQFTMHYFSLFIKFREISSKINIFVTTASLRQFFIKNDILWSLIVYHRQIACKLGLRCVRQVAAPVVVEV